MKRGFQKSLALLLAVFMTFGAVPFFSVGLIASAAEIKNITISVGSKAMVVGDTQKASVSAIFDDYTQGDLALDKVSFSSSNTKCVTIENDGTITAVAPTVVKDESGNDVLNEDGTVKHNPVTIKALYELGDDKYLVASCQITVDPKPICVDTIVWSWNATALLADTGKEYSFAYENNLYKIIPDNADVTSATLACTPSTALQIDNVKKTFKVNAITEDHLDIILTLTADGAGEKCQAATKAITIYKDVPITGIEWKFKNGTKTPLYSYYEKNGNVVTDQLAVYYYMPTEAGNSSAEYKFQTVPASLNYLELCEVTVSSSDKRVITFDETTGRIIPVGNGTAKLTITAKTPKGKIFKDESVTATVQNSPYTPVTSVAIGYDKDKTDSDASYDTESNTLSLMYSHVIQLTANLNDKAKLNQKAITLTLDDGRKIKTVSDCEYSWKSSDESVATVDQTGKVTVTGSGIATITLTINDNGTKITKEVKVKGSMSWWEALVGILMCLFSGRWNKIPGYFKAMFGGLG